MLAAEAGGDSCDKNNAAESNQYSPDYSDTVFNSDWLGTSCGDLSRAVGAFADQ